MIFKPSHLPGLIILAFAMFACQSKGPEAKSVKQQLGELKVDAFIVKPSVLDQSITISGTLKPFEETVIMPEVPGRVVAINLQEGKTVKRGTVLIELFNDDLKAQLRKSQAQLQIAEETLKRQEELIKVSGISQSDYDQAQLQVKAITSDIEVLNVQIGRTKIKAPFDGTVGLRNVSLGAQVSVNTALVTLREVDKLKLDFSVPEKYSSEITPGIKVQFTLQGDDQKYDAEVLASEQGIDYTSRNLKVRAIVQTPSPSLVPGAFATVELRLKQIEAALLIPNQAIIPQEKDKRVIVASKGKAKFVIVKTGIRKSSRVEVLSGINPGDTIITTGLLFLRPGAILKYTTVKRDSI
jgi:membrane fusion protein (multidrug efflux system)